MTTRSVRRPTFGDVSAPTALYLPVSFLVLGLVIFAALTILMIGARSPYTHANLSTGYDPRYGRTDQILVGTPTGFGGVSPSTANPADPPEVRGASLYVTAGCVTCHGLEGRGAPVGPAIAGTQLKTLSQKVRQGPSGMPKFSTDTLTDAQVADIAAYLATLVKPQ